MRTITTAALFTFIFSVFAQKGYYQFPVRSGEQNYLAGSFGEIRGAHMHTGIDVKTGGVTGYPIYAAADGYVSRIKVSAGGYGNALYLKHPNGTYTVYAHLDRYNKKIQAYTVEAQYKKESFGVDLFPAETALPVKKGEVIAYGGNSGSSSGPHLHFEIRDSDNMPIDPLKYGFDEIIDTRAPSVDKIAFVALNEKARVNGFFGRYEYNLNCYDGKIRLDQPVSLEGKIGIEIYSYDPMNDVSNKNGVYKTTLLVDGEKQFEEEKHKLTFSKQRNTLVHFNYWAYKNGRRKFNRLYKEDGNEQVFYTKTNEGVFFSGQEAYFQIFTEDSYGNTSETYISLEDTVFQQPTFKHFELMGNYLHIRSKTNVSLLLKEWTLLRYYKKTEDEYFHLWDLRDGIPEAIFKDGETIGTELVGMIPSNQTYTFPNSEFLMVTGKRDLFDTLYLRYTKEVDELERFQFKNQDHPFRSFFDLTLQPEKTYNQEKAAVYAVFGKRYNFQGGEWIDDKIKFSTRDLATYTILEDTVAPTIKTVKVNEETLKFAISDDRSGIKDFKAHLNGQFVLMYYDPKRKTIWSVKRDQTKPFDGEFVLELIDNANNKTIYSKTL